MINKQSHIFGLNVFFFEPTESGISCKCEDSSPVEDIA